MKTYYNMILALVLLLSFIPVADAAFCDGDFLMENVSVDGTIITVSGQLCTQGCLDETVSNFGEPGCVESDFLQTLIWWPAIAIVFFLLFYIPARITRTGKKKVFR